MRMSRKSGRRFEKTVVGHPKIRHATSKIGRHPAMLRMAQPEAGLSTRPPLRDGVHDLAPGLFRT